MAKGSEEIANNKTSVAAQKVYDSTKEVFATKQKSLYKKTLSILKRFTLECSFEHIEVSLHVPFLEIWFKRILPLMFDSSDTELRDTAVEVVAAFVPQLKFTKYQEAPSWSSTKAKIIDKYSKEIENLRTTGNENWAKIWCLTMQILDVEIVRSAVLINQFLNIVEKGFRSGDLKIRAESFVCWRVLVQIFAKHNELDNPKRIRLICIPLKSSKSKTAQIAENKFYVWWYLIAQFHKNVDSVISAVVEPFLYFCFGPVGKPPLQGYINGLDDEMVAPAKAHPRVKMMAIVALNFLLGITNKKILELNKLFQLTVPATTMAYTNNFNLIIKHLINSCAEATMLLLDRAVFEPATAQEINRSMWSSLMQKMDYNYCVAAAELIKDSVCGLIAVQKHTNNEDLPQLIRDIVEIVGRSDQFPFGKIAIENFSTQNQVIAILRAYSEILLHIDAPFADTKELPGQVIRHIFTLERFGHTPFYTTLVPDVLAFITKDLVSPINRATVDFSLVASIWNAGAFVLIDFLRCQKQFCPNTDDDKKLLIDYLTWPCENIEKIDLGQVQMTFEKLFKQILKTHHEDVNEIVDLTAAQMQSVLIVNYNSGILKVAELFVRVLRGLRGDFDDKTKPYDAFCLFEYIVKNATKMRRINVTVKQLVDEFIKFVVSLNYKSFFLVIMKVRTVFSELAALKDFDMKPIKDLLMQKFRKQEFLNELRLQTSEVRWNVEQLVKTYREADVTPAIWKNNIQKILELCCEKPGTSLSDKPSGKAKAVEEFVVINSVWKMNPDKLTEHQREKMKERRVDIPALYNDMSQSQDTYDLKAWTPNRVVVPHTDDQDTLILLPSDSSSAPTTSKEAVADVMPKDKENSTKPVYSTRTRTSADGTPKKSSPDTPTPVKTEPLSPSKQGDRNAKSEQPKKDLPEPSPAKPPEQPKTSDNGTPSTKKKANVKPSSALKCLHIDMIDRPAMKKRRASSIELREKAKRDAAAKPLKGKKTNDNFVVNPVVVAKKAEVEMVPTPTTMIEEKPQSPPRKRIDFDDEFGGKAELKDAAEQPSLNGSNDAITSSKEDSLEVVESSQQSKADATAESLFSRKVAPRRSMPIVNRTARMLAMVANLSAPAAAEGDAKDDTVPNQLTLKRKAEDGANEVIVANQSAEKRRVVDETLPLDSQAIVQIQDLVATERQTRQTATTDKVKSPKKMEVDSTTPPLVEVLSESLLKSPETRKSPRKLAEVVVDEAFADNEKAPKSPTRSSPRKVTRSETDAEGETDEDVVVVVPTRVSPRKATPTSDVVTTPPPKPAVSSSDSPNLSPIACADIEEFEQKLPQLNTSNRSIISSPEVAEKTEAEMLNDTLNISPIKADDGDGQATILKQPFGHTPDKDTTPVDRKLRIRAPTVLDTPRQQPIKFNFSSPSTTPVRPVPHTSAASSRGAQLYNLVMGKRNESSPKPRNAILCLEKMKVSPMVPTASTRELLTFTKELPARTASPSASILKRKHPDDSFDNELETPAQKRKRVSFLDPPVSSTKEYLVDENEKRVNTNTLRPMLTRCLIPADSGATNSPKSLKSVSATCNGTDHTTMNPKMMLTRRSRAENMMDMVKFSNMEKAAHPTPSDEDELEEIFNVTTSTTNMSALQVTHATFEEDEPELVALRSPPALQFNSEADMLKYMCEKYKVEELVDKYEAIQGALDATSARGLMKKLKTVAKADDKFKDFLLAELSEEHPKESLDHALQENSSESVCQRLPVNSVLDFVLASAQDDGVVRQRLRDSFEQLFTDASAEQVSEFLMNFDKSHQLPIETISQLLRGKFEKLSKGEVYDVIRSLMMS